MAGHGYYCPTYRRGETVGRKRKNQTGLPSRWEHDHGAYFYRVPESLRDRWEGKTKYLLGHTLAEAYHTWYTRVEYAGHTMSHVFARYAGEVVPTLSLSSQRQYMAAIAILSPVFGHMKPDEIEPRHVYRYMDNRPRVAGNREMAVLRAVLSKCVKWGMIRLNPIKGQVQRNRETPRDRYVTDSEVAAFLAHCSPFLRAYVDLKLLTGVRQGQLLSLPRTAWDGERLTVKAAKGGKTVVYVGEALQEAAGAVIASGKGDGSHLFQTRLGGPYTGDGFRSIWGRAMAKYVKSGGQRFTEHDLRAKVASDAEGVERAADTLGHQSSGITRRVYRRRPLEVRVDMPQSRREKT